MTSRIYFVSESISLTDLRRVFRVCASNTEEILLDLEAEETSVEAAESFDDELVPAVLFLSVGKSRLCKVSIKAMRDYHQRRNRVLITDSGILLDMEVFLSDSTRMDCCMARRFADLNEESNEECEIAPISARMAPSGFKRCFCSVFFTTSNRSH